ncbi:MaoC/PaaZ C-terminal domain-containing protein [Celeribacter indicus]|uniref:MaoC-like dehydratase n=1 Tax=Celeribacter indicus TaxID=1208324 RepID=A0A0B5E2Q9_9RHOB|nr:MaoC/PaaZ C-terminal domain-containing protein [Celeribacter indicus]AJE46727.1 MaoC-like dehydratase [Celeribacter indicus]SDX04935.1 Acyl dehydratase [Celeribacter indicus]
MIDIEKLKAYRIPDTHTTLTKRDTMLYALGAGVGQNPFAPEELKYVYEKDLVALPTMATCLATPYAWIRQAEVGFGGKSVHAGTTIRLHRPIPVEGEFYGRSEIAEILDKGPGKAVIVTVHRKVYETGSDELVYETWWTNMYRGDGGAGGESASRFPVQEIPDGAPDHAFDVRVIPQQHLIYRLSGDYNPLHADPEVAKAHGFPKPILHGLSTYAASGFAILKGLCGNDPTRLRLIGGRFTSPVYPEDVLRIKVWTGPDGLAFQTTVPARDDVVVIDNGRLEIA